MTESPQVVTGVSTLTVRPVAIVTSFEVPGVVKAKTSTVISSKVVGPIVKMQVGEGDRVRKGQLLAEIENLDGRAQLEKALAGLREAQGAPEELDRSLKAAIAAKGAAEANRRLADATLSRYRVLRERKSISDQEYDEVEAKSRVAAAEVDRAEKMQQVFEARRQMVEARIGQAQADVVAARALVGYAHITSPLEGVVVTKSADVGSLAAPGVPLLTIEGGGSFQLEIALEQSKIAGILPGTPVRVKLEPPVDTDNVELSGKVAEVVPAADPKSRTFTVRVDLPGNLTLRSGLFGRALFAGGQRDTLLIPAGAVVTRGQLTSVYVVDAAGIVSLRLITLGRPTNGQVEVLSGLETVEKIVASASLISREGVQVR